MIAPACNFVDSPVVGFFKPRKSNTPVSLIGSTTCAVKVMEDGSQPPQRRMLPEICTMVKPTY
jgi:hypothetical protein